MWQREEICTCFIWKVFETAAAAGNKTPRYNALYYSYLMPASKYRAHILFYWCSNPSNCSPFDVEFARSVTDLNDICSKTQEKLGFYPAMYQDNHVKMFVPAFLLFLEQDPLFGVSIISMRKTLIRNYM